MATITIENVPENIVKIYGDTISFDYNISFDNKKENDELIWSDYEQNLYLEGKKDFINGDYLNGKDFFNSLISKIGIDLKRNDAIVPYIDII